MTPTEEGVREENPGTCWVDGHPQAALHPGVTLWSSLFAGSPVNSFSVGRVDM